MREEISRIRFRKEYSAISTRYKFAFLGVSIAFIASFVGSQMLIS
jgi:hypothetical protein